MASATNVTIIGAGPYGLSLAAHLKARDVQFRIFGDPMRFWRDMPVGVNLKSLAFATNVYVPESGHTFPEWCRRNGLEDFEPCTMQSYAAYGCEIQKRFVPELEEVFVTNVRRQGDGFEVTLASGEHFHSHRVISCTGLTGLSHVPKELRGLGPERVRHTFDISNYGEFQGKKVAVIGAGASAVEAGALVLEGGGTSEVFVRGGEVIIHDERSPRVRPLWDRIVNPMTVLGASRRGWVLEHLPFLVYHLPRARRTEFVKRYLGPASPWWIHDRVVGKVPIHMRHEMVQAEASGNGVALKFRKADGQTTTVEFDFVVAGTGYEVDVARLPYLDPELIRHIRCIERAPELNRHFESSVPGLYFAGPISFMCFGPLFRFVSGAEIAAHSLSRRLASTAPLKRGGTVGALSSPPAQ
ncbi:MAG TPA: NAD(P)-binding domain-containing protein [Steroidobacteraceae bacterium]|jgi:cation diffusion facilitator CzcD-associated flavoprotein CzcO